jgi:hypothetical protein
MIPAGLAPVLYKLAIGAKSVGEAGFNITTLALGWALAVVGLLARKSPAAHKRLMLLATVVLTVAAGDRTSAWLGIEGTHASSESCSLSRRQSPSLPTTRYVRGKRRGSP